MLDSKQKNELRKLLILSLEGQMTDQQMQSLNDLLKSDQEALDYYLELITMHHTLSSCDWRIEYERLCSLQRALEEFAVYEKTSPKIKTTPEGEKADVVCPVQHPKTVRKVSRGSLFTLVASAAAIILIYVFAYIVPVTDIEVAVVTDSINAKWIGTDSRMDKNTPIMTGRKSLVLQEGYVKLQFINHAQVVIEGPAEFQVRTEDQVKLRYGRLYAIVPQEAIGFSVYTDNAKIIDLGTEFGVQADISGDTSLYVIRGSTTLIAGEKATKGRIEVNMGMAKRISASTHSISNITFKEEYFARDINSQSKAVWKGQKISLADIVGGGDGLGTGKVDMTLDPISGKPSKESWGRREAGNDYHLVPSSPYIDGVFVPNGKTRQVISSQGHLFQECPVTSGLCCDSLINAEKMLDFLVDQDTKVSNPSPLHVLLLHANMGITYDLEAIRNLLPGVKIARFQSKFGVRKWTARSSASNADFWFLVDGKLRHQKTQVKVNSIFDVDIELSENDRFLTLIETDGGDPERRIVDGLDVTAIDSDWGVFIEPVLVLK